MLRMMRVTADAPMMIFLNGQPAGEFTDNAVYLPVGDGAMIFQAFPLQGDLLSITAKLEIDGEQTACCGPDTLKLYLLRSGQIHVQISFRKIPQEDSAMPYVMRRISIGSEAYASVYFDRTFCFSLERGGRALLGGAFSEKLTSAEIYRRGSMLIFCGKHPQGQEFFAVSAGNEPKVLLHREAEALSVGEDLLEYTCGVEAGVFAKERFGLRDGMLLSREIFRGNGPLLSALAAAVKEGAEDFAMSLIHPSLKREAGFADFCEFFGDFCGTYPSDEREALGLCYELRPNVFNVRLLRANIKDEQIANIEEMED